MRDKEMTKKLPHFPSPRYPLQITRPSRLDPPRRRGLVALLNFPIYETLVGAAGEYSVSEPLPARAWWYCLFSSRVWEP